MTIQLLKINQLSATLIALMLCLTSAVPASGMEDGAQKAPAPVTSLGKSFVENVLLSGQDAKRGVPLFVAQCAIGGVITLMSAFFHEYSHALTSEALESDSVKLVVVGEISDDEEKQIINELKKKNKKPLLNPVIKSFSFYAGCIPTWTGSIVHKNLNSKYKDVLVSAMGPLTGAAFDIACLYALKKIDPTNEKLLLCKISVFGGVFSELVNLIADSDGTSDGGAIRKELKLNKKLYNGCVLVFIGGVLYGAFNVAF